MIPKVHNLFVCFSFVKLCLTILCSTLIFLRNFLNFFLFVIENRRDNVTSSITPMVFIRCSIFFSNLVQLIIPFLSVCLEIYVQESSQFCCKVNGLLALTCVCGNCFPLSCNRLFILNSLDRAMNLLIFLINIFYMNQHFIAFFWLLKF